MPAAIDNSVKTNVIKQWLDGDTRDKIAFDNQIGAGTVSGIINEFKKGVDALEFESVRELSIACKKQDVNLGALASSVRLNKYIQKLGANQDEIETFIADTVNSPDPKKLFDVANQIAQISMSESIPLQMLADHIKRQQDEKQRLEEEIKEADAILQQKKVNIQTVEKCKKLEDELLATGLTMKDTRALVSILKKFKKMKYDPKEIVLEISCVKSLRQREIQLKNSCENLEFRLSSCKEVVPLCEQVMRARIGFPELLVLHDAVTKKASFENLSMGTAAYRVMEEIENYNRLGGLKKQLNDISMQIFMMNQISVRQNYAVNALMKLQLYGITENQILRLCKTIETNGAQSTDSSF